MDAYTYPDLNRAAGVVKVGILGQSFHAEGQGIGIVLASMILGGLATLYITNEIGFPIWLCVVLVLIMLIAPPVASLTMIRRARSGQRQGESGK